jgi:hypothetical protein
MCSSGDVYWYDSCGSRTTKFQECNTASCRTDACFRDCSGDLTFDDAGLEQAVRMAVGRVDNQPLRQSDVASSPTVFPLSSYNITGVTSLGGIECLSALTILEAGGNPISDLSPVRNASSTLYYVSVWSANVQDLSPLAANPNLTYVDVTGNPITCSTQRQYIDQLLSRPGATVLHDCP